MKKTILISGIISGLISATFLVCSVAYCYSANNFNGNMLVGYASMILSFSLIFVGIKNVREKENGGIISFGQAFKIGLYISLIASSIYVLAWLVDYYVFMPDFMEKFSNQAVEVVKAEGASQAEITSKINEMSTYKDMYKSPFGVIFLTYMEILPVGLLISLICALILKKK